VDQRKILIQIANDLLLSFSLDTNALHLEDEKLAIEIQKRFQEEIINYYEESQFRKEIQNLTSEEKILDHLAQFASGDKQGPTGYLPKLHKEKSNAMLECTLTSAFLKLALEERGIKNIRTCLLRGHQVTVKLLDDGIQFFDAANTHTIDGVRHGFSQMFQKNEIVNKKDVTDRIDEPHAFTFEIQTTKTPEELYSGMLDKRESGYTKKFYAHDPQILVSLSVILDNLNDEKETYPFLKDMDYNSIKNQFKILDKDLYL
jgi:hypothetical protein